MRYRHASVLPLVFAIVLVAPVLAQTKAPVPPADYGKWESLVTQPRAGLSPDGRWLAYGVNRTNRNNELRFVNVQDGTLRSVPFGSQPAFSADSRWAAGSIGLPEAEEEKLRQQKKPIHRKVGIVNLATGEVTTIDAVESFAFSADGTELAMKRYAPERKDATPPAPSASAEPEEPAGATLIVRDLATGRDTTFGNVTEFAWQDKGPLLTFAIGAEDRTGNGIQLYDPRTGALRVLDSSAAVYSGLAWRKDTDDLAALRARIDETRDGPTQVALAWRGLAGASPRSFLLDPSPATGVPEGTRTVAYRRPSWSDDGATVFLGMAKWQDKIALPAKKDGEEDEEAAVDVWHARDVDVMPRQKVNARADRQRNLLAAWQLDERRIVPLSTDPLERVTPLKGRALAVAANWAPYAMDRSIGRPAADVFIVDVRTGQRTKVRDRIEDQYLQASPGGRYLLYVQADHYWTIDTASRAVVNITKAAAASFVDRESDATIAQKPPFGVAGWTKDDAAVLLYDKFDIWQVAADGSGAVRLTDGGAEQIRHRYARLNPDEEWIDTSKPVPVTLFGIWTKRSGYGRLDVAARRVERLAFEDRMIDRLGRAKDAEVYAYVSQDFDDPADVFVASADLRTPRQVTSLNAFQTEYSWGRSELIEYKSERGERLQGALFYPAGYQPGRKYPMIVYMYERLSDGVHRAVSPSDREPYNTAVFTSLGYIVLQPDIVFRPREPGLSVLECVGPAVRKVTAMGLADPGRVGIVGHSWGGFDTVFLATHSELFAAAVAGAPITDLVSNYGNHHWSAGIAETDHIETGQQRMQVPLWEDLPAYIRNSAVFGVQTMKTPLLLAFGDNDGTCTGTRGSSSTTSPGARRRTSSCSSMRTRITGCGGSRTSSIITAASWSGSGIT